MELKNIFEKRRSVNFFDKSKTIETETLKKIINLAVLAPSAFNLQPWKIVAVKSDDAKQKLYLLANKQPKILEASAVLIVAGNLEGYAADNPVWKEFLQTMGGNREALEGAQQAAAFLYGSSPERKMKFAESNAALLAMSIMYAAKEFGVDTHPMSGMDFDGVQKEFLPDGKHSAVMLICVGYFDESKQLYERRPRLFYDEIVEER